jgi:MFS family permease
MVKGYGTEPARRPADGHAAVVERTIRALQVGQFLRSCQHAFTNAAQTTLALQITGGNQTVVAAVMSRAGSLSALFELLMNPIVGSLSDNFGRKPIMLCGGMAKFLPYLLCAFCEFVSPPHVTRLSGVGPADLTFEWLCLFWLQIRR